MAVHVLVFDGLPIAAAKRLERLNDFMATYTPMQQAQMHITAVRVLE